MHTTATRIELIKAHMELIESSLLGGMRLYNRYASIPKM